MGYSEPYLEPGEFFDIEAFLEESQQTHRERLEDELAWVNDQLEERDDLHKEIVEDLASKLDWYYERLELLYKRSFGKEDEKNQLKETIKQLNRRLNDEKRKHWRDRRKLEERRREVQRELDELAEEQQITKYL